MKIRNILLTLAIGLVLISLVSAASKTNVQNSPFINIRSGNADEATCKEGTDFLVQITPFGCTPQVVRSDLLEEQDVSVYCELGATKINPILDISAIESVSFSKENYPKEVKGIGFYPANKALGAKDSNVNNKVLNNAGYVVITLKKQANESAMPDFVQGNLSAKLKYDIKKSYGVGDATFYLSLLSDEDWETQKNQYAFWEGKGYLRVENIGKDEATIAIYNDDKKIKSVTIKDGQKSENIYLPGFDCLAGFELKLEGMKNPERKVRLKVDSGVIEVRINEPFLDNKCMVKSMSDNGIAEKVEIKCNEDQDGFFKNKAFPLEIFPMIKLKINGEDKEAGLGDFLYQNGNKYVYLGYIGTKKETGNLNDLYLYFIETPEKKAELSESELADVAQLQFLLQKRIAVL
ncbi:MAG: hypothetical protein WC238_05890 [Parcubacteria group bacterium]|jgi:hypothetical protein